MIIYGTKTAHAASEHLRHATCEHCGTQGSLTMHIYSRYAHIFWIPFFPFAKIGISECGHCKQSLENKEMPESLKQSYRELKSVTKHPRKTYFIFLAFAFIFVLGSINAIIFGPQIEQEKQDMLANPAPNDMYFYETETGEYSIYKVNHSTADSVFVLENQYEIGRRSQVDELDEEGSYFEDIIGFSKAEIKAMYDEGTIFEIERD